MNPENMLPGVITDISTQTRDNSRVSVFLDGAFFCGFYRKTVESAGLKKGYKITKNRYRDLVRADSRHQFRDLCFKLLSHRDHTPSELRQKAKKKGIGLDFAEDVLDEFIQKGYINLERFTRQFILEKVKFKKWGPQKIKSELQVRGVPEKLFKREIDDFFSESGTTANMEALLMKNRQRFSREKDILKRRKKMYDYLIRKGYHSGEIMHELDRFLKLIK